MGNCALHGPRPRCAFAIKRRGCPYVIRRLGLWRSCKKARSPYENPPHPCVNPKPPNRRRVSRNSARGWFPSQPSSTSTAVANCGLACATTAIPSAWTSRKPPCARSPRPSPPTSNPRFILKSQPSSSRASIASGSPSPALSLLITPTVVPTCASRTKIGNSPPMNSKQWSSGRIGTARAGTRNPSPIHGSNPASPDFGHSSAGLD